MKKDEYIETLICEGHLVNIGLDEPGQQYFFEYLENDELKEVGLGAYNSNYVLGVDDYFKNKIPTPEEFKENMEFICSEEKDPALDPELNHKEADRYMCSTLKKLGYEDGIKVFENMEKWYS